MMHRRIDSHLPCAPIREQSQPRANLDYRTVVASVGEPGERQPSRVQRHLVVRKQLDVDPNSPRDLQSWYHCPRVLQVPAELQGRILDGWWLSHGLHEQTVQSCKRTHVRENECSVPSCPVLAFGGRESRTCSKLETVRSESEVERLVGAESKPTEAGRQNWIST
jgi:hypothetical protein